MSAAAPAARSKIGMDIEQLLRWAYVDELSKRQTSAAEGIWDGILDYVNHGGIDSGRGAAQRYSHFGLPDPDAERIERAVAALNDAVVDWDRDFEMIAGDMVGLVSVNDLRHNVMPARTPRQSWGNAGRRALKAWYGSDDNTPIAADRPRDVLLLQSIKTDALVTRHAVQGTRPDWTDNAPEPSMTPASRGTGAKVVGECRGKNLYTAGSYCPLQWSPSPLSIILSRVDYVVWRRGLVALADRLALDKFDALPPKAPIAPWTENDEWLSRVIKVVPNGRNSVKAWGTLPLKPDRHRAGPPRRRKKEDRTAASDPV